MRPTPIKLRKQIAADPFMRRCIYSQCNEKPEWEHAFLYAGKQINEAWNIIPVCAYHHRGWGFDKDYNRYRAIIRADIKDLQKRMPKKNWTQIKNYLTKKFNE